MSMPKVPKKAMPQKLVGQFPNETGQIGMNANPFEQLISAHGIRMIHQKPLPCPNQQTLNGGDHDPNCSRCYNGFLYYGQTEFIGAFMGNSINRQFGMNGTWDLDQAQIVVPSKDKNGAEMDFQFFDQIQIPDFTVRYYQRVQASQTGIDRLHFPAAKIDKVIGSDGTEYRVGVDCQVDERGWVKWISGGKRPGFDLSIDDGTTTGGGEIYSINYYTRPSFTVISLPHQIRGTQSLDENGNSVQARFPQLVVVRKDFIPHQNGDVTGQPDAPEPRDGQV